MYSKLLTIILSKYKIPDYFDNDGNTNEYESFCYYITDRLADMINLEILEN